MSNDRIDAIGKGIKDNPITKAFQKYLDEKQQNGVGYNATFIGCNSIFTHPGVASSKNDSQMA